MSVLLYFLKIKANVISFLQICYRRYITDTISVKVYKDGNIVNYIYYYYIIRLLRIFSNLCSKYIKIYDIIGDEKVCITKNYDNSYTKMIFDKKGSINDIINHLTDNPKDRDIKSGIFSKFELVKDDKRLCLKKFILDYNDIHEKYDNTIENILLFENPEIIKGVCEDMYIHVTKRSKKGRFNKKLDYLEYRGKHINYFIDL